MMAQVFAKFDSLRKRRGDFGIKRLAIKKFDLMQSDCKPSQYARNLNGCS